MTKGKCLLLMPAINEETSPGLVAWFELMRQVIVGQVMVEEYDWELQSGIVSLATMDQVMFQLSQTHMIVILLSEDRELFYISGVCHGLGIPTIIIGRFDQELPAVIQASMPSSAFIITGQTPEGDLQQRLRDALADFSQGKLHNLVTRHIVPGSRQDYLKLKAALEEKDAQLRKQQDDFEDLAKLLQLRSISLPQRDRANIPDTRIEFKPMKDDES